MHGYDMNGMNQGPQLPPPSLGIGPPPDSGSHHPDSTDSYVTYYSDDSMTGSPWSSPDIMSSNEDHYRQSLYQRIASWHARMMHMLHGMHASNDAVL